MAKVNITSLYSCKRSKSWMTYLAVFMFAAMILMELYLIIVIPVELKRRSMLTRSITKLELVRQMDSLRPAVRNTPARDDVQAGEKSLCKDILDFYANFLRENINDLTAEQFAQMKKILNFYQSTCGRWNSGKHVFYMKRETLNLKPAIDELEKSISNE